MNLLIPQRVELFHPMIVHFPVALLLTGLLARFVFLVFEKRSFGQVFKWIYLWSWSLGSIGLIGAYLTGEEAEDVANKLICDPTVTHDHADFALYTLAASFSALLLFGARSLFARRLKTKLEKAVLHAPKKLASLTRGVTLAEVFCLLTTAGLLIWTAHLGGKLVYEQGAGFLREPNEECEEPTLPFSPPTPEDDGTENGI